MSSEKYLNFFKYFLICNFCFLFLQALLILSKNGNFVGAIPLPAIVWYQIAFTGLMHLTLYLILSILQTFLLTAIPPKKTYFSTDSWLMIIWGTSVLFILSGNAYYYPLSVFSTLLSPTIASKFTFFIFILSGVILLAFCVNALISIKWIISIATLFIIYYFGITNYSSKNMNRAPAKQPNIILLGIDSLSPISINEQNMPFLSNLLAHSVQFTHSISPLARTYPAWTSILTGLYAQHHHATENLVAKNLVQSDKSIGWILQRQGYETVFATDDRRFNPLGHEFGFKHIIGPKTGINDVILGSFNDFPLSNLLMNLSVSRILFPFNYINRASYFSYYPQTFSFNLEYELKTHITQFPVFLAVHFALPHWPYAWAESSPVELDNEFSIERRDSLYQKALHRVDMQYAQLFNFLRAQHYLDNALLILLSDHGEVLYYPGSRYTSQENYKGKANLFTKYVTRYTATSLNKSAGHGSDLLSPEQYHNVLAFRIYHNGLSILQPKKINSQVALIDLAPTIMSFLHISTHHVMDGINLLQKILLNKPLPKRSFFIESGMFPNQILSKTKARDIGIAFYKVNAEDGALEIKHKNMEEIEQQKIYGLIQGTWLLALYPEKKGYVPVILNLKSKFWSDNLQDFFASTTPVQNMFQQVHKFYDQRHFRIISPSADKH
ncbi:MAG: sulfatase [Legionella sp. 40-6]|nr:sulfatase-like hydrolase/transferase [Legionella sp.]OJY01981.1 MAG: sulfatase [Legionella sp. 40-6]